MLCVTVASLLAARADLQAPITGATRMSLAGQLFGGAYCGKDTVNPDSQCVHNMVHGYVVHIYASLMDNI